MECSRYFTYILFYCNKIRKDKFYYPYFIDKETNLKRGHENWINLHRFFLSVSEQCLLCSTRQNKF